MIEQVVGLRFKANRESLGELNTFSESEVHGIYRIAAIAGIAANVAVRSSKECRRAVVVENPTHCACCRWSAGIEVHQTTVRQRSIGALSHGTHVGPWIS